MVSRIGNKSSSSSRFNKVLDRFRGKKNKSRQGLGSTKTGTSVIPVDVKPIIAKKYHDQIATKFEEAKSISLKDKEKINNLKSEYKKTQQKVKDASKALSKAKINKNNKDIAKYEKELKAAKKNQEITSANLKRVTNKYKNQKDNLRRLTQISKKSRKILKNAKKLKLADTVIDEYQDDATIHASIGDVAKLRSARVDKDTNAGLEEPIYMNMQQSVGAKNVSRKAIRGFDFKKDVADQLITVFSQEVLSQSENLVHSKIAVPEFDKDGDVSDPEAKERYKKIQEEYKIIDSYAKKELEREESEARKNNQTIMIPKEQVKGKFNDIGCIKRTAASDDYHANLLTLEGGNYIAAQGPNSNTAENFVDMLADKDSPISISLVEGEEFANVNGKNEYLDPKLVPTETQKGNRIEFLAKHIDENLKVRVDQLKINGKLHIRLYDLGWIDHSAGTAERILAMSCLTQKLLQNPEFKSRKNNPITVNCNAGVGRTGTFITADALVRNYMQDKKSDIKKLVEQGRQSRVKFVQKLGQYSNLHLINNNKGMISPFLERLNLANSGVARNR